MERDASPLFTVGIISYNNFRFLEESVGSVLRQDYPAIELILSDDGSADFDEEAIRAYIERNKRENLVQYTIERLPENQGTVKNTNNIVKRIAGELFLFFAADDALFDESTLSRFAAAFDTLPDSECIVTARAKMSDEHLNPNAHDYPFVSLGEYYNTRDVEAQYKILSVFCIYASGATAYRSRVFKEHGAFDETYYLVEDLPYWLRLTRAGIRLNFFDFSALLHRDGGVSHPEDDEKPTRTLTLYWKDIVRVMEREVLPYQNRFAPQEQDMCMQHYKLFRDRLRRAMGAEAPVMSTAKRIFMNLGWYARRALLVAQPRIADLQSTLTRISTAMAYCAGVSGLLCLFLDMLLGGAVAALWLVPLLFFCACILLLLASGAAWVVKEIGVFRQMGIAHWQDL